MTQRAISLPFSFDSSGGIGYTIDEKKIWQDRVVLVVMTGLEERIMIPSFGTNVKKTVFESINDALSLIKQEISYGFATWLKQLSLVDVVGTIDNADGYLSVEIRYRLGASNQVDSVKVKTAILNRSGDTLLEITNG